MRMNAQYGHILFFLVSTGQLHPLVPLLFSLAEGKFADGIRNYSLSHTQIHFECAFVSRRVAMVSIEAIYKSKTNTASPSSRKFVRTGREQFTDQMYRKTANFSFNQIVGHMPRNLFCWKQNKQIHLATYLKDKLEVLAFDESSGDSTDESDKNNEKPDQPASSSPVASLKYASGRQTCISDPRSTIIEARVIELDSRYIFIVITESNIQFHDLISSAVLHTFIPDDSYDGLERCYSATYSFASGITKFFIGTRWYIFIGFCTGGLLAFSYGIFMNESNPSIQFEGIIPGPNPCLITNLFSDGCSLISGDFLGNSLIWRTDSEVILKVAFQFEGVDNFAVTSVALCGELAISSYGSGHIRVYSLEKNVLLAEVNAHAGWINSMEVSTENDDRSYTLVTVSDDSMVRFWQVKNDFPCIKHLCDQVIENTLVVGLTFADGHGDRVFVTGYDSSLVTLFERQSDRK